MSWFFIVMLGLLLVLGVQNLVVGVSNDAVNFLNSALGSRIAPYWVVMAVASLGVVLGATFSNGMMGIAEKGILLPQYFSYRDLMFIFFGALVTNVLVLDGFNTYGLPTSTTVTFVFSLLGGTLASALMCNHSNGLAASRIIEYFNAVESRSIISELFWSVPTAFIGAALMQYLSRIIFGFNYQQNFKVWGPLWCAISISFIIYYLLFQGFGGASFATDESILFINKHAISILPFMGLAIFGLLYYLYNIKGVNILKIQILAGTFALAMAFAGNNLVNFIGISLCSIRGYNFFTSNPGLDMSVTSAGFLADPMKTPTVYLLTAGLFIVLTIWLSKKAKTVTHTELQLSRQASGYEIFKASFLSRVTVNASLTIGRWMRQLLPQKAAAFIDSRYQTKLTDLGHLSRPSFDPIRASVNLTVSTILISAATSRTIPISTTYITFMAAMGSSLADGAWNRENAGNRVSGVIYVFVGWLLTALLAFSIGFLVVLVMQKTGSIGVAILLAAGIAIMAYLHYKHKQFERLRDKEEKNLQFNTLLTNKRVGEQALTILNDTATQSRDIFQGLINTLAFGDRMQARKIKKETLQIHKNYEILRDNIENVVRHSPKDINGTGKIYVQTILGVGELSNIVRNIAVPCLEYAEQMHPSLNPAQLNELQAIFAQVSSFVGQLEPSPNLEKMLELGQQIEERIAENKQAQLNLIKTEGQSVKSGILYLKLLSMFQNFTEKTSEIAAMQSGLTIR